MSGESFAELLERRRMVRSYLPDPIDHATIERIVGTVRRAPSAGFSQGHRLVVVTEPETRQELARLAGEEQYVAMGMPPWISVAPVHVVVGVREESYHERYRKADKLVAGDEITWPAPYWYVDAGSMFMLLQLAALVRGARRRRLRRAGRGRARAQGVARPPGGHPLRVRGHDWPASSRRRRQPARVTPDGGTKAAR